jgi:hypothetical protein
MMADAQEATVSRDGDLIDITHADRGLGYARGWRGGLSGVVCAFCLSRLGAVSTLYCVLIIVLGLVLWGCSTANAMFTLRA